MELTTRKTKSETNDDAEIASRIESYFVNVANSV